MGISYKTIFLFIACVFIINLSIAAPPVGNYTEVKNVPQGEGLNGLFYINDVSANYNIWFADGNFYIDNPMGATDRTLKIKYVALENKFGAGVNRLKIQHKNDFGVIDSEKIVTIGTKDAQGFVYITGLDFSTIIIGGVSATLTQTCSGLNNGEWCNLSNPVNSTTVTVNITEIASINDSDTLYDNFEDGNISDWTIEAGSNVVVGSDQAYLSDYSIKQNPNGTVDKETYKTFDTIGPGNNTTIEFDWRFDSGGGDGVTLMIEKTASDHLNAIQLNVNSSLGLRYYDGSYNTIIASINDSQWYHIKIIVYVDSPDSTFDIYVDDMDTPKKTNASTRGLVDQITSFAVRVAGPLTPGSQWIDNIIIGDGINTPSNMYVVPENHPTSENKTTDLNSMILNYTLTPDTLIQNSQFFKNTTGSFNVEITYNILDNFTIIDETYANGYHNISGNYTATQNLSDLNITIDVTNYTDFLTTPTITDYGNLTGSYPNFTLVIGDYTAPDAINFNLTRQYFNVPVLTYIDSNTSSITVSSNNFTGIDTFIYEYSVNGSGIWNYSNTTNNSITLTDLDAGKTYDIRARVNRTSDGTLSNYSNTITITTPTGDEALDAVLAQMAIYHANTTAQITTLNNDLDDARAEINALWGGMLMSGILVIGYLSHIRRKLKEDKDYD